MTRPVVASIDLLALRQNLQIVRRAAPGSRLWAVVKANAYGHGVARVWSALSAADGFALLNLEEAILLREQGWKGPILLLEGFFHADELAVLDQYRLTTSVHSNWQIKALQQAKLRAPLDIYLNAGRRFDSQMPALFPGKGFRHIGDHLPLRGTRNKVRDLFLKRLIPGGDLRFQRSGQSHEKT